MVSISNTPPTPPDQRTLRDARQRIAALRGFYVHLLTFVAIMTVLTAINLLTSHKWWVQWPLLGWGIGLLAHASRIYGRRKLFGPEWERRKLLEFLDRKRR